MSEAPEESSGLPCADRESGTVEIPLFPLHTVLFPGGPLPLRIFEARYLDMVSACLRAGCGFGIGLIRTGREVGEVADTYEMGTLAHIEDWHKRHDGLLGITVVGRQRFQILSVRVQPDQLAIARVNLLPPEAALPLPDIYLPLADVARHIIERLGNHYASLPTHYGDAAWVSYRLAELLPLRLAQKQYFLQLDDPLQRLERLRQVLDGLNLA